MAATRAAAEQGTDNGHRRSRHADSAPVAPRYRPRSSPPHPTGATLGLGADAPPEQDRPARLPAEARATLPGSGGEERSVNSSRSRRSSRRPTALRAALLVQSLRAPPARGAARPHRHRRRPRRRDRRHRTPPPAPPAVPGHHHRAARWPRLAGHHPGDRPRAPAANTFEAALVIDMLDEAGQTPCACGTSWRRQGPAPPAPGRPTWPSRRRTTRRPCTLRAYELSAQTAANRTWWSGPLTLTTERPPIIITTPGLRRPSVAPGGTLAGQRAGVGARGAVQPRAARRRPAPRCSPSRSRRPAAPRNRTSAARWRCPRAWPEDSTTWSASTTALKDGSMQYEFPVQSCVAQRARRAGHAGRVELSTGRPGSGPCRAAGRLQWKGHRDAPVATARIAPIPPKVSRDRASHRDSAFARAGRGVRRHRGHQAERLRHRPGRNG